MVVGVVVGLLLPALPSPPGLGLRFVELGAAFALLTLVAGYLATRTGAGPAEAAALAFDPPLAFRWSYTVLQVGGALTGWALGAAVGPGTLITALLVGLPSTSPPARCSASPLASPHPPARAGCRPC